MKVRSARDFFDKLVAEQTELNADLTDHRVAINTALTAWHLCEWVWQEIDGNWELFVALAPESVKSFATFDGFRDWATLQCPALRDMEAVAVGAKHLSQTQLEDHEGDFDPRDFDRDDFDVSRLTLTGASGGSEDFDRLVDLAVKWWREFLEKAKL